MSPEVRKPDNELFDKKLVGGILDKMGRDDRYTTRSLATLSFEQLYSQLSHSEIGVIKKFLALKPKKLGFLGPFVSLEGLPDDLVQLGGQVFKRDGEEITIANQHLPQHV